MEILKSQDINNYNIYIGKLKNSENLHVGVRRCVCSYRTPQYDPPLNESVHETLECAENAFNILLKRFS